MSRICSLLVVDRLVMWIWAIQMRRRFSFSRVGAQTLRTELEGLHTAVTLDSPPTKVVRHIQSHGQAVQQGSL